MPSPFELLFGHGVEREQLELQKKHAQTTALSQLLDDPKVTIDAKSAIATHLDDIMNVPSKNKGLLGTLVGIFHHQQPKPRQSSLPPDPYGANDVVASPDAGTQTMDSAASRLRAGTANADNASLGLEGSALPDRMVRKGSLTTQDLANMQRFSEFTREQKVRADYDTVNDQRTQDRQLAVQKQRGEDAMARVNAQMAGRKDYLSEQERLRAQRKVQELVAAGYTPEQASEQIKQDFDASMEYKKARRSYLIAQSKAIPERTEQAWQRLDNDQLRTEIYRTVAGNQARRDMVKPNLDALLTELKSVRDEIEYHSRYPTDADQQTALKQAQAHESGLLNELWKLNKSDEVAPQVPSVPSRPLRRENGSTARPNFNLRQWKTDHPNATKAEVSAKRNQYAGKYNVIE